MTSVAPVLRSGGRLAIQEPVAGPVQPPHYPLMWTRDASSSFLRSAAELRAIIRAAGFSERVWEVITARPPAASDREPPPATIQALVMGPSLGKIQAAAARNRQEGRLATVQAVPQRH